MEKVTVDEVRKHLESGSRHVAIFDARAPDAWNDSGIKAAGAIRVPPDNAAEYLSDVNRDDYVVAYCT
jgi:rhodanese-related sulfurtransferase